jgi:hypothetical protein
MKNIFLIVPAAIFASAVCFGLEDIVLRPELSIMKPLVGQTWVGEMKDPSGKTTLHLLFKYEPMHEGKVLKYSHETKELNNRNDVLRFIGISFLRSARNRWSRTP